MQGSSGRVLRNESGFVADQQLALDLLQANLSAGWHKMTVQGRSTDNASKGVETGECAVVAGEGRHGRLPLRGRRLGRRPPSCLRTRLPWLQPP